MGLNLEPHSESPVREDLEFDLPLQIEPLCPVIRAVWRADEPAGFHVEMRQISVRFPGANGWALRNIDIEIRPGERVAILGPSGAGKSTLLSLLTGMRIPTEGCVHFDGRCWNDMSSRHQQLIRRRIGKIYQDFRLVPQKTALENVLSGYLGFLPTWRTVFGFPRACHDTAEQLLSSVGLGERINHPAKRLSGGEKQRVALARALAQEPGLLLADEPTASLDLEAARGILQEINRVGCRGVTIVAVMHDIELAEELSPRALLMKDGRVVYDGTSRNLRDTMRRVLGWSESPIREE